ncbi:MAG: IPT/TIG domain-containing protein, partial [Gallionella sp.]
MSAAPTVTGVSPNSDSLNGGTTVTITGTGFTGATAVNFNGAGASNIQVISDTQITATNPNTGTPGQVNVEVQVQGTWSATAKLFTYCAPVVTAVSPNSGSLAGNIPVTITGQYFTGATAVNFNGAGASNIQVISDTQITATNPNTGTPGQINVEVQVQGTWSAPADLFTYKALPAVTGLSPGKGANAGSTAITINGSGFTRVKSVMFGSNPATNINFVSDAKITATAPAGSGTVDVTVTTSIGTSAICGVDQFQYASIPLYFN